MPWNGVLINFLPLLTHLGWKPEGSGRRQCRNRICWTKGGGHAEVIDVGQAKTSNHGPLSFIHPVKYDRAVAALGLIGFHPHDFTAA